MIIRGVVDKGKTCPVSMTTTAGEALTDTPRGVSPRRLQIFPCLTIKIDETKKH